MLKEVATYVVIGTVGFACLGILALVMARDADATLVCAMRDISRESHVRMSYQRLLSVGVTPVGTVLNGVPLRQYARRYGSYTYANSPSES